MEYKDLCLKVIEKEMNNFEHEVTKHSTFEFESSALFSENFDRPYNRCVYLSRYANSCLYIFKNSIEKFLSDSPDAKSIVSEWKSHAEVKVCSLSTGPGLDYFAFMLAILKYDPLPPNFIGATVLSKYGAWQNTAHFMQEVLREQSSVNGIPWSKFNYNIEVTQIDDLKKCFSQVMNTKHEHDVLSNIHILLMMRTLNLYAFGLLQENSILQMLKELVSSLRSDATIFCVDTIPSLALFHQALSCFPGKFLYGPIHQTCKIPVSISEGNKYCSKSQFNGTFFVWRKLPYTLTESTSLGKTLLGTNCARKTVYGISGHSFTAEKSKQKIKTSEILPWRELPLCKISWGQLFWQNASLTTKKSLKSVMSLKKEYLERHWIGEVANLYMKEYGTPEFSILSGKTEKISVETHDESSKESAQMVTDILAVPNILMSPHSAHILEEVICDGTNPGSKILEENSLNIVPSAPSSDFLNTICKFEQIQCEPIILEKDSLGQESNKGEMPICEALKQSTFDVGFINDASPIEMVPLNTDCDTGNESMQGVCKSIGNSKSSFFKLGFSAFDKCNEKPLSFESLPWRELPSGKISWGEVFWQNSSPIMKKSLKSLLSLNKEAIEHHWINEVFSLYQNEFGTLNVSKSSERTNENISSNCSHENTSLSRHTITEILNIPNISSCQSDHNLKDLNNCLKIESTLLEEISFDIAQSCPSLDFRNKASNFNCQSIKCDLAIQSTDSSIQDLNKRDIGLPTGIKETSVPNPTHVETKANVPKIIQKIDPSIKALTESIKQLVTSVERVIHQNRSTVCCKTNCHQYINSCLNHQIHSSNTAKFNICSEHIACATHCHIPSESRQNSHNDNSVQCSSFHCRCQYSYKCNIKSLPSCHSRACNKSSCHCSSSKRMACSENHNFMKSPNIIIPTQSTSCEVLLEIISILKTEYKCE